MPIEVEAPDGTVIEFPDGMTDAQIAAVMRREYPAPSRGGRRVPAAQPARRPPPPASGPGSTKGRAISLSRRLKIGSPEYRRAVAALPPGAYYIDPNGGIRQNINPGGSGNPQVGRVTVWQDITRGLDTGVAEGVQSLLDPFLPFDGRTRDDNFSPLDLLQSAQNLGLAGGQRLAGDREGAGQSLAAAKANTAKGRLAAREQTYQPTTFPGRVARTAGQMLPSAIAPGSIPARAANVVVPALTTELGGDAGYALGGDTGEQVGRFVGGLGGGFLAGLRLSRPPREPLPARSRPLDAFARRTRPNPEAMAQAADDYRSAGLTPTLADVTDDTGRGLIGAAARRPTPARQEVTDFRDARALNLPDRISAQARRLVSPDPRTPDAIRASAEATRRAQGNAQFGAVRSAEITLDPDTVLALRSPRGRAAIKTAAENAANSLDPDTRALANRLNTLAGDALDNPGGTRITVGMAQEISDSLFDVATRSRDMGQATNETRLFTQLAEAVRKNARTQVPAYDEALTNYAANSRLRDAAEIGEAFPRANTDEFVSAVQAASPDELALIRAGARRAIERSVGENPASAPGFARRFSTAPEPIARTNALLGPEGAGRFRNALALEERAVRNANDIAPRVGSQTANRLADDQVANAVADTIQVGGNVATGNVRGVVLWLVDKWRTRGISDDVAQDLTRLAIDPNATDDAINYIRQRYGPDAARAFIEVRQDPNFVALLAQGAVGGQRQPREQNRLAAPAP
jgi:hypothetical protein